MRLSGRASRLLYCASVERTIRVVRLMREVEECFGIATRIATRLDNWPKTDFEYVYLSEILSMIPVDS